MSQSRWLAHEEEITNSVDKTTQVSPSSDSPFHSIPADPDDTGDSRHNLFIS